MDFASEYQKNIKAEMIKVICPICGLEIIIYPEHIGRVACDKCKVDFVKAQSRG